MKIEPNMYVRTKSKGIVKIDEVIENGVITYEDDFGREWEEQTDRKVIRYISNDGWNCGLDENDILKASHNIIDLIEVGDVIKFDITDTDNYADIQGYNCWEISCKEELNGVKEMIEMESAKLISIVTREQFKSMEYRLGDK